MKTPLPIDGRLAEILALLRERRRLVLTAPPGAGKTTRVAPALAALGRTLLLQPRRVAARGVARRIAAEQGVELGQQVGYQVRFERRFTPATRLLVATEGVLTRRLRDDPLLGDFQVVVFDEFHERSLEADLALALVREAGRARPDLHLVVMSATLDPGPVAAYLEAPGLDLPGRQFPIDIEHAPGLDMAAAVRRELARAPGDLLCFLPGQGEIRRTAGALGTPPGVVVLPLHGGLEPEEQDRALAPCAGRKVILATNLAETSITVEGVRGVIDSGLVKIARYDPRRAIDRLDLERVTADSAAQRAGRAGRTAPGRALRLWEPGLVLRPRREPEIERVDVSAALLAVLAWGGDPLGFAWLEPPPRERARAALDLLERLGAAARGAITTLGRRLLDFPLHPRLATLVLQAGGGRRAARAAALLGESDAPRGEVRSTDCDLFPLLDRWEQAAPSTRRAAEEIQAVARRGGALPGGDDDEGLRRALLAAYPDRVAQRREPGSPRLTLASGHGAALGRESGVLTATWLVALEVIAAERAGAAEARVTLASRVERDWLVANAREVVHRLEGRRVRAFERLGYDALPLGEREVAADPEAAAPLLARALREHGPGPQAARQLRRARFAGIEVDLEGVIAAACAGTTLLPELDVLAGLAPAERQRLDRLAPDTLLVPSGRRAPLDYREDGGVVLAVKLQELFGLEASPRLGARGEPLLIELLSPAGRPVQTTRDLASFWRNTYPAVRKELRGRYPRHPWPEDPLTAPATARARPRPR